MKSFFGGPVRGHIQVDLLSAYLDQQATPAERAYIDAHLQQCMECRAELDTLRRTVFLLRALPRVAVPRAFTLSEAQVGIRRPAASPGWSGGLARGLGAVAALALVALVAFSILRPDKAPWNPPQTVARAVPTAAPVARVVETQPVSAPAAAEAPTQQEAPAATAAQAEAQPSAASAPPTAPEPPQVALMAEAPSPAPTETAADTAAAPAPSPAPAEAIPGPTSTSEPALVAKLAPSPTAGVEATGAAPAAVAAAAAAAPEMGSATMGRGGGGPSEPVGIPPEFLTPEATPAARPLADALPSTLRLAYSDLNALWAIDRDGGLRRLVQGRGINTPQLSPDQQWVAYRTFTDKGMQVWAVRWEGGQPKLLLDDATLPSNNLPNGYTARAISDTRWAPKGEILLITLSLVPGPDSQQPPKIELWQVNVETGELQYSSELGRAWRPYYSPDGQEYLVLQYGTEEKPEGSLSLVEAKSGKSKMLLTFPASIGKNSYDNQVSWTPDSKTAWVAIPTADYGTPAPPNGTTVYRVTAKGDVKEVGEIDAAQVNWSPAGAAMAYTRYTDETLAKSELYLAKPDGSQAQLYTPMSQGEFISWSPKGTHFIYQDNFQVFAGAAGQPPTRLANASSMTAPRWVSETEIVASQDTTDGWLLALRDVSGEAVGLLPLPRETMWDARAN